MKLPISHTPQLPIAIQMSKVPPLFYLPFRLHLRSWILHCPQPRLIPVIKFKTIIPRACLLCHNFKPAHHLPQRCLHPWHRQLHLSLQYHCDPMDVRQRNLSVPMQQQRWVQQVTQSRTTNLPNQAFHCICKTSPPLSTHSPLWRDDPSGTQSRDCLPDHTTPLHVFNKIFAYPIPFSSISRI